LAVESTDTLQQIVSEQVKLPIEKMVPESP